MAMQPFQAESKKLMDLMINSIYTNKEIFLRELISNASDAIDKLYFKSLTDTSVGMNREDFRILLTLDKENRMLTVSDNGIGMTREELEQNLGTIAHSGSQDFKTENTDENIDIIGQFGVGFYSAFMVADHVTVITRAHGSDQAWQWESSGVEGYEITPAEKETAGTDIILHIKDNTDTENYDNYVSEYGVSAIVKKYSDYIRYPIQMERTKSRQKPEPDPKPENYTPEWEEYTELETLNSMVPIWKKQKSEVTDEEYNAFYKNHFGDYADPARVIVSRTEGTANYNALLFVPSHRPYDYYTKEYEKGLALYASGVLIMDKCADLLPDYFSFVKGIVDSQDLSLNISRETLQKDSQLKLIHNALEKKIKNELNAMLVNDRDKYEAFWKEFGRQIKFGAYSDYGMHAELLRGLLLFYSAKEQKMVTLEEYVEKMPAEQKYIYFAAGDSADRLAKLPTASLVLDKGYDLLLLTEDVDEFCFQIMHSFPRKDAEGKDGTVEFKNINSNDLGLESEEEKKAAEEATAENKSLFDAMKTALEGKIKEVRVSTRLKDHPVCLSADGPLSIEMEKVLSRQPGSEDVKSDKVLEINASHPVFAVLKAAQEAGDTDKVAQYSQILYAQAQLIEGLPVDDPVAYADAVCALMK
ncbi:molecular chaperone HtpG [Faecalibacterium sp. An122]|uniref:molecular chaperone HtpG n=1 Tax=Faecalibacterium sp. An122 TaxID=1965551 RepID=UPI000B3842A7|nr:molecular chaperone HtpG [Faecalibacterium sp. An122]OUQ39493.1 molecular chaperone HtpG [Faecalibacterium sp. An122]